jgi:hypothetical protein
MPCDDCQNLWIPGNFAIVLSKYLQRVGPVFVSLAVLGCSSGCPSQFQSDRLIGHREAPACANAPCCYAVGMLQEPTSPSMQPLQANTARTCWQHYCGTRTLEQSASTKISNSSQTVYKLLVYSTQPTTVSTTTGDLFATELTPTQLALGYWTPTLDPATKITSLLQYIHANPTHCMQSPQAGSSHAWLRRLPQQHTCHTPNRVCAITTQASLPQMARCKGMRHLMWCQST